MSAPGLPSAFRPTRAIARLQTFAVACGLAAAVAGGMGRFDVDYRPLIGAPVYFVFGLLAAQVMRRSRAHKDARPAARWAWVAIFPLSTLAVFLDFVLHVLVSRLHHASVWSLERMDIVRAGAIYGGIYAIPISALVFVACGLPLAYVESVAAEGLSRRERAGRALSVACGIVCVIGLLFSQFQRADGDVPPFDVDTSLLQPSIVAVIAFATLGLVAAASAIALVNVRERNRRAFVDRATEGEVEGIRVVGDPHARRLVRIAEEAGSYRASTDAGEELVLLDEEGHVTHTVEAARRLR
jgi:hypothetical protein